jgi:epoxyqueuosine reductase
LTIEHRGEIAEELSPQIGAHVYGCDICQEVCPWNSAAPVSNDPSWQPRSVWDAPALEDLDRLTDEGLQVALRGSAMKRAKPAGIRRNIAIATRNGARQSSAAR